MATTCRISELKAHEGEIITLQGWVSNKRTGKGLVFAEVRDGSGFCQCIIDANNFNEDNFEEAKKLSLASSLTITGTVVKDDRQIGGFEVQVTSYELLQLVEDYPISKKAHGVDFLLEKRHLWLRSKRQWAVMRIRSRVKYAVHTFFQERGFTQMDSPMFTGSACEGTTTLFETDYYGQPAYLTQSGQLYAEASAMAHGLVYTFGPTFRAEKSKTRRHLSEFWMIEPEMAYYDLDMDMELMEDFVRSMVLDTFENCKLELEILGRDLKLFETIAKPFPKISYTDAVQILKGNKDVDIESAKNFKDGEDFGGSDETVLTRLFDTPIMVYNWPQEIKAFYMKRTEGDDRFVKGVDCLAPDGFGEIVGGSERETDINLLLKRIAEHELDEKDFDWYLDLRKYGSVPHSGFGLGFERLIMWLTDVKHIRETIPFPRYYGRLFP
ncbi:UNVERIFIED_CONTAM: hypothetical protein GTU68_044136 [Idotea baltica]|nr:hypothetical protein [Idotea baltica]